MVFPALLLPFFVFSSAHALDNAVGQVPPLGFCVWQSYNRFINERIIEESIDALAKFRPYGYEYVNIDDAWMDASRDPITNSLQPNLITFPNGIKALADRAHSLDLKFGIYTAIGSQTCDRNQHPPDGDMENIGWGLPGDGPDNNPGSLNHYEIDAQAFADWGVDYVKIDDCQGYTADDGTSLSLYKQFTAALNQTGRPMYYVTCSLNPTSPAQTNVSEREPITCGRTCANI